MKVKKKRKLAKRILPGVLAFSMLAALTGCGGPPPQAQQAAERGGTIAVICKAKGVQFWDHVKAGAEDACSELGYELMYDATENDTQYEQQIELIKNAIRQKVKAIVIAPDDVNELNSVLGEAEQAGIPVITINSDVSFKKKKAYIGSSNSDAGAMAARNAYQSLSDFISANGGMKIAVVGHVEGAQTAVQRIDGFTNTLQGYGQLALNAQLEAARQVMQEELENVSAADAEGNVSAKADAEARHRQAQQTFLALQSAPNPFEIVDEQYCDNNRTTAQEKALQIIRKNPDVKVIYTTNENSTLGVCDAIDDIRNGNVSDISKDIADNICVFGFNANTEEVDYINDGILTGTVVQNPYNMGYLGVRYCDKVLGGEKIISQLDTGCTYVNKENIGKDYIQLLMNPDSYGETSSGSGANNTGTGGNGNG